MVTIPYIDALMADIASITKKLTPKVAVSIWGVFGRPVTDTGQYGAKRGSMFLLALDADAGNAMDAFVLACSESDHTAYVKGQVEEVKYMGWAHLPDAVSTPNAKDPEGTEKAA